MVLDLKRPSPSTDGTNCGMGSVKTAKIKDHPLRFTLAVTITSLIVAVSVSILAISYFGSARSLLILSEKMSSKVSDGITAEINLLMSSAEKTNAVIELMVAQGSLDLNNGKLVMDAAEALLQNEGFTSIEIGLPTGSKYKVERAINGSIFRYSDIRTSSSVMRTFHEGDPDSRAQHPDSVKTLEEGYDARKRPWFVKAVTVGKTIWTDMYVSSTSKQFLYSCVTPIYDKDGALLAVTSTNVKLIGLSQFLGRLKILDHGKAFVVNDQDQVIAVPIKSTEEIDHLLKPSPEGSAEPYQLYGSEEVPDRDIRLALIAYRRDGKPFFEMKGGNGEPYVADLVRYPYKGGPTFIIGVVFPKRDIMGDISRNTRLMLLAVLLFLLVAVLVGFRIAKRISRSLAILCDEVDKVSRLELGSDTVVESRIQEVVRIGESVQNMKRGLRSFKKYVPVELVMQLNALKREAVLGGELRELTIFFSDIANFTTISEELAPECLVQRLGVYFDGMSRVVLDHAGTLDKYIGDAIMAFWGAPSPRENHAYLACATALQCQQYLDKLAIKWQAESHPVFRTRIGIHTGKVIVGNIGSEDRINYTIIGDAANLASRLEGLNKLYQTQIIISEDTYNQVKDRFVVRKLDRIAVQGKSRGILVYELIGTCGESVPAQETFLRKYEQAMDLYLCRSWAEARQAFAAAQKLSPRGIDYPSELLSSRCEEFMRVAPEAGWNGSFAYTSK